MFERPDRVRRSDESVKQKSTDVVDEAGDPKCKHVPKGFIFKLRFKIFQPITMGIASPKRGLPIQRIEIAFGWSLIGPDPVARDPHLDLRTHPEPHKRFRTHCRVIYEVSDREKRVALRKPPIHFVERSEERRVGKECRSRWTAYQ